jgi:hypothetical protein
VFEDPIRHSRWLAYRPARGLAVGAALVVAVIGSAVVALQIPRRLDSGAVAASASITVPATVTTIAGETPANTVVEIDATSPTTSPGVAAATTTTDDPVDLADAVADLVAANAAGLEQALAVTDVPANLRPSLSAAADDKPAIYDNGCMLSDGENEPRECVFGNPSSSTTIVLFGDSHAAQWFPALHRIAEARGWRLESLTKQGCPTADVPTTRTDRDQGCAKWRASVFERLAADEPELVVMSSYRYNPGGLADEPWRTGLDATLTDLRPVARQVLVLGDTPTPVPEDVPSCLAANLQRADRCTAARSRSVVEARVAVERELAGVHDATFAPTGDWLCTDVGCPVIFGDVLLYRDGNHISTAASVLLIPYLEATIVAALDGSP